jgi:hypothetical protein
MLQNELLIDRQNYKPSAMYFYCPVLTTKVTGFVYAYSWYKKTAGKSAALIFSQMIDLFTHS